MQIRFLFSLLIFSTIYNQSIVAQYNIKEINSNTSKNRLIEMPYSNSGGERGTSIFEYDSSGYLEKSFWTLLNKSRSSNNFYTYDDKGNIIKKYREFSDGLTSTENFTYDENNKLVKEHFSRSDGVSNNATYFYNHKQQLTKAKLVNYHGWLTGEINFSYENSGLVHKGDILSEGAEIGFITYTYDEQNRLIKEYWEFYESYNQTFSFIYEDLPRSYSSSNVFITNTDEYKIVEENYDFNKESGGPSLYFYSNEGSLDKKIFKVDNEIKTSTFYFYDASGLLTHSIRKLNDGKENIFKYKFNEKCQLTDRINYLNDSIIGEEHYSYEGGLLVKGEYLNFDYWLNGSLSFEHDASGKLLKGYFKGMDGFDATLFFNHDQDGNITKIYWEFSFGKTQTYTFAYEKIN